MMNSELFEHLKIFTTNPYLFVGSGLSRRYISLPTWEELLSNFFDRSHIEDDFGYYKSASESDLPLLASNIALKFHEIWWRSSEFRISRDKRKRIASNSKVAPMKIELSEYVKSFKGSNSKYTREIEFLKSCVIDGIITTNWDTFLDNLFNEFDVYVGQQELIFSEAISIGEIYKIHGSVSDPLSLILTKEDYENFNSKNAYLAAKLLTLFLEHPIIFIGYSLSDENVLSIINSIVDCVQPKNLEKLKDRLIFVEWRSEEQFEMKDSVIKLPDGKVLPIKLITTDSFEPIFETLSALKRQIPVKILKRLKNSVVEFVKSNSPKNQVYIKDIDTITDDTEIEYAIGVGMATQFSTQGYKAFENQDIIEDVLFDKKNLIAKQLIEDTFPRIRKGKVNVPIYKYLRAEKYLNKNGTLNAVGAAKIKNSFLVKEDVPHCFQPSPHYQKKS